MKNMSFKKSFGYNSIFLQKKKKKKIKIYVAFPEIEGFICVMILLDFEK